MHIKIDNANRTASTAGLVISHRDELLIWDVQSNDVNQGKDTAAEYDIFQQINGYWAQCPEERQDKIFEVYTRIYQCLSQTWNLGQQIKSMRPLVAELFTHHPEEDVFIWVWTKADVAVPSGPNGIKRYFDPTAEGRDDHKAERTYVEDDYRKLIALSVALRIMIPVWGQFMLSSKSSTDNLFKEYQAFELMATAPVMEWEAMKRFTIFVNHTIPKDRALDAVIVSGISSHDFAQWVLALTVVRRLCRGDVRGNNPSTTLIAYLYVYLTQRLRGIESTTGKIIEKYTPVDRGESDSNFSLLEGFKIKESVPAGDIAAVSFYIQYQLERVLHNFPLGPLSLCQRLSKDPKFPDIVKRSYESIQALAQARLNKIQVTIAGWVMNRYVPIRSIAMLQKTDLMGMISFAQAFLWIHGHKDLAALVSAISKSEHDGELNMLAVSMEKIDKPEMEELIKRFPFRKRNNSRAKNAKSTVPILTTIDEMVEQITYQTWNLTLPTDWVGQLTGNNRIRRYVAPKDIRTKIARLIIQLDDIRAREMHIQRELSSPSRRASDRTVSVV